MHLDVDEDTQACSRGSYQNRCPLRVGVRVEKAGQSSAVLWRPGGIACPCEIKPTHFLEEVKNHVKIVPGNFDNHSVLLNWEYIRRIEGHSARNADDQIWIICDLQGIESNDYLGAQRFLTQFEGHGADVEESVVVVTVDNGLRLGMTSNNL